MIDKPALVLVTGGGGFTGGHLLQELRKFGFRCRSLESNLLDPAQLSVEVAEVSPDYVIHLGAISYVEEQDAQQVYAVNTVGSFNLLSALATNSKTPKKVIIASSAAVYGSQAGALDEGLPPSPVSHYGCSKLSMEYLSRTFADQFEILVTRPFNYTGVGHGAQFLVPKLISAVTSGKKIVELGNISVSREFNDVRDICRWYRELLTCRTGVAEVNLCSGNSYSIETLIEIISQISSVQLKIKVSDQLIRSHDINEVRGNPRLLSSLVNATPNFDIEQTLRWMLTGREESAAV